MQHTSAAEQTAVKPTALEHKPPHKWNIIIFVKGGFIVEFL